MPISDRELLRKARFSDREIEDILAKRRAPVSTETLLRKAADMQAAITTVPSRYYTYVPAEDMGGTQNGNGHGHE